MDLFSVLPRCSRGNDSKGNFSFSSCVLPLFIHSDSDLNFRLYIYIYIYINIIYLFYLFIFTQFAYLLGYGKDDCLGYNRPVTSDPITQYRSVSVYWAAKMQTARCLYFVLFFLGSDLKALTRTSWRDWLWSDYSFCSIFLRSVASLFLCSGLNGLLQ